jgi:hypothetical protein
MSACVCEVVDGAICAIKTANAILRLREEPECECRCHAVIESCAEQLLEVRAFHYLDCVAVWREKHPGQPTPQAFARQVNAWVQFKFDDRQRRAIVAKALSALAVEADALGEHGLCGDMRSIALYVDSAGYSMSELAVSLENVGGTYDELGQRVRASIARRGADVLRGRTVVP